MTPPLDLVECSHCHSCFTADATDEVFHHGTARCRAECHSPQETQTSGDPSPA